MEKLRAGDRSYLAADFSKPFTFSSRMKTGTLDSLDIGPERKERFNWHMCTDSPPPNIGSMFHLSREFYFEMKKAKFYLFTYHGCVGNKSHKRSHMLVIRVICC